MSDADQKIECEHGGSLATYVCRHVRDGIACGYHFDEADKDDAWPDAWCDRCEHARAAAGEWTEALEDEAEIAAICTHAYEAARERNRRIPPPLEPGMIELGAIDLDKLVQRATRDAKRLQDKAMKTFLLGKHERWEADYENARFMMTSAGQSHVLADMQIIGSYSKKTSSWLWSWANETNEPACVEEIARLKTLGEVRGIKVLAERYHENVDESFSWQLAALSCHLLGYEACYRAPMDHRHLFMLLKNLRWTS